MTRTEIGVTRGRPRKFDIDAGVDAALNLFSARGYDGVNVSEICTLVGITPTSLYAAYTSKFNLFRLAITRYKDGYGQFVATALAAAESPHSIWSNVLLAAAEQYSSSKGKGCPVLDGLLGSRDPEVIAFTIAQANATQDAVRDRLRALGDPDADASAAAILVVMRGLSTAARAGATFAELTVVVHGLLNRRLVTDNHRDASAKS